MIASGGFDGIAAIYQASSGVYEHVASLEGHESEVKCAAWERSGNLLATCSRDKSIWIWEAMRGDSVGNEGDLVDFDCVAVLHGHSQDVKCARWHPTQQTLISGSYDNSIKVWAEDDTDWVCVLILWTPTIALCGACPLINQAIDLCLVGMMGH